MQIIIVAEDSLAPLGRQLAHALSLHEEHSGTYWTLKHYADNEASLGKQPVIFVGESDVSKSYTAILPLQFTNYGTTCWFEGAKAVLSVDNPGTVSVEELARFERVVVGRAEELRHIAEAATLQASDEILGDAPEKLNISEETASTGAPIGVQMALSLLPAFSAKGAIEFIVRKVNSGKRRRAYLGLQYRYILDRFLKDEFEAFIAGVDGT